jgi:MOSC domain-containing protein YiiM
VDCDGQGDLAGHGGEQQAVIVYQIEGDKEVCVGDRYRIGTAVFEVTQPRVTCYRVWIRMHDPRIPALLVSHRRPGF